MRGEVETVRELLRQGLDVNAAQGDGMTALHWAADRGDAALADMLIYAGADGAARADYFTAAVTLDADADLSLFDADGSAIIIHENPDTYGEDAGAGGRVACGVITRY